MTELTTGIIENTLVDGIRSTSSFTIKITNNDTIAAIVQINGFYVTGTTKTQYVLELFSLADEGGSSKIYYAEL